MEGDVITLQDLFVASFVDEAGGEQVTSKMRHTGIRPGFDDKLEQHGVTLPKSFFGDTTANVDVLRRGKERRTGVIAGRAGRAAALALLSAALAAPAALGAAPPTEVTGVQPREPIPCA